MFNLDNNFREYLESLCGKENEPEYNLTINQIMNINNIGKHYKSEYTDTIFSVIENKDNDGLEFIVVKPREVCFCSYDLIEDVMSLDDILSLKFKEVELC